MSNDPDAAVEIRTLILTPLAATVPAPTIRAVREVRVILIGGASGVGKSTTARSLAARLGWDCISTDRLARHPGRPWTVNPRQDPVPDHVLRHYRALSVEELATRLLRHYEQLWPTVEALILSHASDPGSTRLILEGSAILPDGVAALPTGNVAAMWLTAAPGVLADRIRALSRLEEADHDEQALVRKFIARTVRYEQIILGAVARHGLPAIQVAAGSTTDDLVERCLQVADLSQRSRWTR